jgi:hypothetical protein
LVKNIPESNHPTHADKLMEATEKYLWDSYKGKYYFQEKGGL